MASVWSNEETFKFIELYQRHSVIWNPRHKCHKDKNKVNDAWKQISDEMQVPLIEIKKKKEHLLSSFRINHKKVLASRKSGSGEDEVFKPSWIFYDALEAFMSDVYDCKSILTTEGSDANEHNENIILDEQGPSSQPPQSSQVKNIIPVKKRRCHNPPELAETNEHMKSALSTLQDALAAKKDPPQRTVDEDDCDLYGRLIAKVLREFNEIDRLELRHVIDGIILKKKRSIASRHYVTSPSQIILTTNRPSTSKSMYSEQLTDAFPPSPYVLENCLINRPSSSRSSMYSSPSPVSANRIQNQQNMSQHVYAPSGSQTIGTEQNMSRYSYAVASPPLNQTVEIQQNTSQYGFADNPQQSPDNQSADILQTACMNARI